MNTVEKQLPCFLRLCSLPIARSDVGHSYRLATREVNLGMNMVAQLVTPNPMLEMESARCFNIV